MKKLDFAWIAGLAVFVVVLLLPPVQAFTAAYSYAGSFVKFGVLAPMGEMLSVRIASGKWTRPAGLVWRMLIWGAFGVAIGFAFTFYNGGAGLLVAGMSDGFGKALLQAFLTSVIMNLTFGPMMMASHRITDAVVDLKCEGKKPCVADVVNKVDWVRFVGFVALKTLPLFWIPAHTAVFLLPGEFRILAAALLSVMLGVLLSMGSRKKV